VTFDEATRSTTERVAAPDGTPLLVRRWPVPSGHPWASILMIHGLAEHSGRYEAVGRWFAEAGIAPVAFDLRGFGASGGRRAWIERWSQFHDDVEDQLLALRAAAPGRPAVAYGHSLGGLIALGYVLAGRPAPDALVLSAPAIGAAIPRWQRGLALLLDRVAPRTLLPNRLDPERLSRDSQVQQRYLEDPLNQHRSTAHFARLAFDEQILTAGKLGHLAVPTLVIHGGADRIVPAESTAPLESLPGVTRRVHPGLRHEMHNEIAGIDVYREVTDWLIRTLGVATATVATRGTMEAN
jgi:alpha-beta hydrolase superfamily lysophospholipase